MLTRRGFLIDKIRIEQCITIYILLQSMKDMNTPSNVDDSTYMYMTINGVQLKIDFALILH